MKKRLLSLLLALVMILGMIPATAITANALSFEMADAVIVNNVGLDDGYYVLEGSTEAEKGTPPADADYAYFKDHVLYLKNFDITTYRENWVSAEKVVKCGIGMYQYINLYLDDSYLGSLINDFPLTIHLTGTNRITDSLAEYSIYACYEATVTFTGDGTLEMNRPMEVSAGTTVKSGTVRMTESGAGDKVPMIKTENFKMEGGELNMRAAYRSGIECTGFAMSSGKLDVTVLGNSQYTGSGLLTTGSVTFSGGTAKIQSDGDAVQCSSLTIQDGVENVKFISTAASERDGNYMAVDASFVTMPTELVIYVSDNADGSDASVFTSGSLIGYDYVEVGSLLSGKISGVTSNTKTLVHIYETGNEVPLEIISVIGNGTYRFLVPKFGDYTILAVASGYEQQKAKITVSGNTTQNFAMVEKPKFTTQPVGGTVGYNQRHIVNWATNFDSVKQELVRYSSADSVVQIQELDAGAFQASLSYMTGGYYYRIRAYYDYYNSSYIESDKVYVTPDQYFSPNPQYGNTEEDIIEGITYVPNGDGTFNAHVHVNLNCVDGQMLQHEWVGTGYCWYDHNNTPHYGSVGMDTNKFTFTLDNLGKDLEPGKEWKVKVYLADDYYADWEWQGYSFNYFTDTVPEFKAHTCADSNNDHLCDTCGEIHSYCVDGNQDHLCDICKAVISYCADLDKNHKCDTCGADVSECIDSNGDYKCDICGKDLGTPAPIGVIRLAGANRWATSLMVADELKANLGIEKFGAIIVASGNDFADALAGSYLSTVKNAPILLGWGKGGKYVTLDEANIAYIKANLAPGGTVYILGGKNAVPELYETSLSGITVKRLGGANRFETNLLILEEAGVPAGSEVLVCTSTNFADSLSASATGKPILLVFNEYGKLYGKQPEYLAKLQNCTFTVIGGESAVSAKLFDAIKAYGNVTRLAGANRFETSVLVAQKYFAAPATAVLAYAWNYPDGLCGGSLAYSMKAPLILTMTKYEAKAVEYATGAGIKSGVVLGGDGLISDAAVRAIFAMAESD